MVNLVIETRDSSNDSMNDAVRIAMKAVRAFRDEARITFRRRDIATDVTSAKTEKEIFDRYLKERDEILRKALEP